MQTTTIKICGLREKEDVILCHELGVDMTGFIFAEQSARYVSPEHVAALPVGVSKRVGVFTGSSVQLIEKIADRAKLDFIQLHGNEPPDVCKALGPERIIKVFWPEKSGVQAMLDEMPLFEPYCAFFLLDAGSSGGGSGKTLSLGQLHDMPVHKPWLLAGGIGVDTIQPSLEGCHPFGLDMNSALEDAPAIKNHALVREAVHRIRRWDENHHEEQRALRSKG